MHKVLNFLYKIPYSTYYKVYQKDIKEDKRYVLLNSAFGALVKQLFIVYLGALLLPISVWCASVITLIYELSFAYFVYIKKKYQPYFSKYEKEGYDPSGLGKVLFWLNLISFVVSLVVVYNK